MIRKLFMTAMLLTFLTASSAVFAAAVHVTENGAKYHKEICRLIKDRDNVTELEKKQAVEDGYEPCKRCFKEDVVTEDEDK